MLSNRLTVIALQLLQCWGQLFKILLKFAMNFTLAKAPEPFLPSLHISGASELPHPAARGRNLGMRKPRLLTLHQIQAVSCLFSQ